MPQMAPMSWLILFIMFSLTLILFSTMNYSYPNFSESMVESPEKTMHLALFWKW
uniref:ATP synthase complex subunit 8 n=1 Tax=Pseudorhynchus crassiceps TaxID=1945537 RepID=A0A1Q1MPM1_9ORTH|nr:ATP synthase F0 subunit 8 [Pseudorhynchus crassiceps]AQM40021.1 ATP synthase F0 subunit 8 [Pseudorhynchus crassiceps]